MRSKPSVKLLVSCLLAILAGPGVGRAQSDTEFLPAAPYDAQAAQGN